MNTKLFNSLGEVYRLLERPRAARRLLVCLLAIHTLLLGYSAYVHSPTLNEPAHLVAGLSHWKFGRFELYCVNPPLVRMVAALPVMTAGYIEDWSGFYEGPGARPEIGMGENFVAANGKRSYYLFMIARWACIPFSWLGMIVCFLWGRDLFGRPAGVMAATIWCFEPNILAHASLFTPDAGATALGLAACYTFWRWLKQPTWTQAALTGVVLGLAELAKTTLILFYALWPLMWLMYRWSEQREGRKVGGSLRVAHAAHQRYIGMTCRNWLREAAMLTLRMAIGLYILNLGYGFEGSLTRLKYFTFVSDLFTGREPSRESQEPIIPQSSRSSSAATENPQSTNRFAQTWLGDIPVPFPKHYVLGIDIQQRDFEHYGRPSYLRGVWRDHGWWYYYLYACSIKVPLGLWALCLLTIFLSLREKLVEGEYLYSHKANSEQLTPSFRDFFILLFPPIVIFAFVSSKTGFSEHMRYVLPTFPYFFIAVSCLPRLFAIPSNYKRRFTDSAVSRRLAWETPVAPTSPRQGAGVLGLLVGALQYLALRYLPSTRFADGANSRHSKIASPVFSRRLRVALFSTTGALACTAWLIVSSLWTFPHSLSYFNECIGGPLNGPEHLLGSNVDWGQDLMYLSQWLDVYPHDKPRYYAGFHFLRPIDLGLHIDSLSEIDNGRLPEYVGPRVFAFGVNQVGDNRWLTSIVRASSRADGRAIGPIPVAYSIRAFEVKGDVSTLMRN